MDAGRTRGGGDESHGPGGISAREMEELADPSPGAEAPWPAPVNAGDELATLGREKIPPWAMLALLTAATAIPLSLLWDYSWESTIGIDPLWSPPHVMNVFAVFGAGLLALWIVLRGGAREWPRAIRCGSWTAPIGIWAVLWGAAAFGAGFLFDQWWQSTYGLAGGIWHPPQCLKTAAYFAILLGVWLVTKGAAFALAGGNLLAMVGMVTLAGALANRQHSVEFYQVACGTYPLVLAAMASGGNGRFTATRAAAAYLALGAAMVWLLPLCPAAPLVGPIFHPRTTFLPPPFPLLLVLPALAMDRLLRADSAGTRKAGGWGAALEAGLAFAVVFGITQWLFSAFLLSSGSAGRLFAGGGINWPFFLQIEPGAEQSFWLEAKDAISWRGGLVMLALATIAVRCGLWLGSFRREVSG